MLSGIPDERRACSSAVPPRRASYGYSYLALERAAATFHSAAIDVRPATAAIGLRHHARSVFRYIHRWHHRYVAPTVFTIAPPCIRTEFASSSPSRLLRADKQQLRCDLAVYCRHRLMTHSTSTRR